MTQRADSPCVPDSSAAASMAVAPGDADATNVPAVEDPSVVAFGEYLDEFYVQQIYLFAEAAMVEGDDARVKHDQSREIMASRVRDTLLYSNARDTSAGRLVIDEIFRRWVSIVNELRGKVRGLARMSVARKIARFREMPIPQHEQLERVIVRDLIAEEMKRDSQETATRQDQPSLGDLVREFANHITDLGWHDGSTRSTADAERLGDDGTQLEQDLNAEPVPVVEADEITAAECRNGVMLRWYEEMGKTDRKARGYAIIRDRWNKEHPNESVGQKKKGADVVRKAIAKAKRDSELNQAR